MISVKDLSFSYTNRPFIENMSIVDGKLKALDILHNLIMAKVDSKIRYTYLENGNEKQREVPIDYTVEDELLQKLLRKNRLLSIHRSEPMLNEVLWRLRGVVAMRIWFLLNRDI
jgi:small nuclear ribonucleoprotein (snRNP)-like protein